MLASLPKRKYPFIHSFGAVRKQGRGSLCPPCPAFKVKPHKLEVGQTVEDVANDKGMSVHELLSLNHELDVEHFKEGQNILVPADTMSKQDRHVLNNMMDRSYRTYVVRRHEAIEDIIEPRDIRLSEVEQLNPDSDLDNLSHREIIKLPVDKYSAHEQYEMQGTFGAPAFFRPASLFMNSLLVGVLGIAAYSYWLWKLSKRAAAKAIIEKKVAAAKKNYEVPSGLPQPSYMASVEEANVSEPIVPPEATEQEDRG